MPSVSPTPAPTVAATNTPAPTQSPTAPSPSPRPMPHPRSTAPPPGHPTVVPSRPHVLLVMLENKGYAATLGSCSADPYLCSLAAQYMSATAWEGIGHPSLPNYLAIKSGSRKVLERRLRHRYQRVSSRYSSWRLRVSPGTRTWSSMPYACYGGAMSGEYTRVHNPFVYYTGASSPCHDDPYPGSAGLLATLGSRTPPDFVWISPNLGDDMHNGSVQQGDAWLRGNLAPILASPWFIRGDATVIVTMDENDPQSTPMGGQVPMVVISSKARGRGAVAIRGTSTALFARLKRRSACRCLARRKALRTGTWPDTSDDLAGVAVDASGRTSSARDASRRQG